MTKASELRTFDHEELVARLRAGEDELLRLRFRAATNQLDNVSAIKNLKRELARIYTLLHESELGIVQLKPTKRLERKQLRKERGEKARKEREEKQLGDQSEQALDAEISDSGSDEQSEAVAISSQGVTDAEELDKETLENNEIEEGKDDGF